MTALRNPFDVLPTQLFNVLGSGGHQQHYIAVLLRIYTMAEFNRFGLTREMVIAEIVDYVNEVAAEEAAAPAEAAEVPDDALEEAPPIDDPQEYASWVVRRLVDAGWLEREQDADYTEYIILPDYAFTLLEALRNIQEQKPREYTGQLYTAHQLLTSEHEDFSAGLALTQAYENVRQMVRGLNELNQNIRRYTERVTKDRPVAELLRLHYEDYAQVLGPAYHALKTSDHVSRYRRDIVARLQRWELDEDWLTGAADELATQGHISPAQAADEVGHYIRFIVNQLESLDPLLSEIDRRHAQYLRLSLRQIQYQLVGTDGDFKERLMLLARELASLEAEGQTWLPPAAPTFHAMPLHHPDTNSFYTPPRRRAPFTPDPVIAPVLNIAEVQALREATLDSLGQAITPAKIQNFVGQFFNGHRVLHIADLPSETFADADGLSWLIYTIAYGNHPEVNYDVETLPGDPVRLGEVRVQPFQLLRRA